MDELDLHIIPIIFMLFILGMLLPATFYGWSALALAVIPQGRIGVSVFWDYAAFNKPKATYLLMNECLVVLSALAFVSINIWLR